MLQDFFGKPVYLPNTLITAAANADKQTCQAVQTWGSKEGIPYVPRRNRSIERLFREEAMEFLVVRPDTGPMQIYKRGHEKCPISYHPGVSIIRVKQLLAGGKDKLMSVAQAKAGETVLDCSAGFGSDAAVFSFIIGETRTCLALEANPHVAFMLHHGMASYDSGIADFNRALKRISVAHARWQDVLPTLPSHSFDMVYVDPMFDEGIEKSSVMQPLRAFAELGAFSANDLTEARRVARRAVVIKGRRHGALFQDLGLAPSEAGQSSTAYAYVPANRGDECV